MSGAGLETVRYADEFLYHFDTETGGINGRLGEPSPPIIGRGTSPRCPTDYTYPAVRLVLVLCRSEEEAREALEKKGDCAAYCAIGEGAKAEAGGETIIVGQTPASARRGCNPWCSFAARSINLREEQITNWRAGCRKSASPVREEGRPYPVSTSSYFRLPTNCWCRCF